MAEYAKKNDATLIQSSVVIQGVDVKAAVTTDEELGEGAKDDRRGGRGGRGARPRPDRADRPCSGVGGSIGPLPGGGGGSTARSRRSPSKEWKEIEEKIGKGAPDLRRHGRRSAASSRSRASSSARTPPSAPSAATTRRRRLPLQVRQPRRDRRQLRRPGDLDPHEIDAVDPIIDDLRELGFRTIWRASGPLQPPARRRRQLRPDRRGQRRRRRRLHRPARGRADGGAADRLGRARRPVLRLRRRRRRLLRRPARPEGGARDLHRGARPRRLRQGAAGGLRGGDRRVRRAQPALRRPRLDRALPAARLVGLATRSGWTRCGPRGSSSRGRSARTGRG